MVLPSHPARAQVVELLHLPRRICPRARDLVDPQPFSAPLARYIGVLVPVLLLSSFLLDPLFTHLTDCSVGTMIIGVKLQCWVSPFSVMWFVSRWSLCVVTDVRQSMVMRVIEICVLGVEC